VGINITSSNKLTVPDLRLFLTSVLGQEPWKYDSKVVPLPWRSTEEEAIKSKIQDGLNLGYYSCDGVVGLLERRDLENTKIYMIGSSSSSNSERY
jgi:hypothetical protein